MEKQVSYLLYVFRDCENYLTDYKAGKQNIAKLLAVLHNVVETTESFKDELVEKHHAASRRASRGHRSPKSS